MAILLATALLLLFPLLAFESWFLHAYLHFKLHVSTIHLFWRPAMGRRPTRPAKKGASQINISPPCMNISLWVEGWRFATDWGSAFRF
ncbi:hypothetical protein BKA63DRAFT_65632 [Paraphoma chrysanthemicola]|nr:hypothetical protein BKA63DRAFT_65632 [Paraphoma chrysanthemicola]